MAKCKNCKHLKYKDDGKERYAWCPLIGDNPNLEFERFCGAFKKMTNADRIRRMTDAELAWFLCKVKADYQWINQEFPREDEGGEWEEWLKSEAED